MSLKTEQIKIDFEPRSTNYQPNLITESRHEFTDMEKRIVVLAINQLRRVAQIWQSEQNVILLIPFSELTNSHHGQLAETANGLNTKRIFYQDFTNPVESKFNYIIPFPRVCTIKLNGKQHLELVMFADVVPAFIELGKRYTSYSLKLMLSLSSVYAQRMYEIIMMFYGRGQKEFTYEVNRLRTALNYPAEHDYFDFKRKALTKAQREMADKIGLYFEFTPSRKLGKAVTELRFVIRSDKDLIDCDVEADLLIAQTMKPYEIAAMARNLIHSYKFTWPQQNQILADLVLMSTFIRLHTEFHHGKRVAKNPTAYMAQALGFGKGLSKTRQSEATSRKTGQREPKQLGALISDLVKKPK